MNSLADMAVKAGGLFATTFVITLSGAVMPGPILARTISYAASMGTKAGPLLVLGHAILELVLLLALLAGLAPFLTRPTVMGLVGAVGAVILWWMAAGMLRSLPGLRIDWEAAPPRAAGPVRDGILLSLANPYWSVWWATVGLSLVVLAMDSGLGWWGFVIFFVAHILSDLSWYLLVSWAVARGRRFLSDRRHRLLVGACAVFLVLFGGYFAFFAWQRLVV